MKIVSFTERERHLPKSGRWLVASATPKTIVVYQSLPRAIAKPAIQNQRFSDPFNFKRLSWIKPSFLWTMHRTRWGKLDDCVLAIRLDRHGFLGLLRNSISVKHDTNQFPKKKQWDKLIRKAEILTQWDPEYDLMDRKMKRKAIQIGLRGNALRSYAKQLVVEIVDLTDFVQEQRVRIQSGKHEEVLIPVESTLTTDPDLQNWLGIVNAR